MVTLLACIGAGAILLFVIYVVMMTDARGIGLEAGKAAHFLKLTAREARTLSRCAMSYKQVHGRRLRSEELVLYGTVFREFPELVDGVESGKLVPEEAVKAIEELVAAAAASKDMQLPNARDGVPTVPVPVTPTQLTADQLRAVEIVTGFLDEQTGKPVVERRSAVARFVSEQPLTWATAVAKGFVSPAEATIRLMYEPDRPS